MFRFLPRLFVRRIARNVRICKHFHTCHRVMLGPDVCMVNVTATDIVRPICGSRSPPCTSLSLSSVCLDSELPAVTRAIFAKVSLRWGFWVLIGPDVPSLAAQICASKRAWLFTQLAGANARLVWPDHVTVRAGYQTKFQFFDFSRHWAYP